MPENDHIIVGLFLGSLFYSIHLCVYFCWQYHNILITVASQYSLKSRGIILASLFFFLKIALATQGLLCFHANFRIIIPVKNAFC